MLARNSPHLVTVSLCFMLRLYGIFQTLRNKDLHKVWFSSFSIINCITIIKDNDTIRRYVLALAIAILGCSNFLQRVYSGNFYTHLNVFVSKMWCRGHLKS